MKVILIILVLSVSANIARASFLNKVNDALKTVESVNNTADKAERESKRLNRTSSPKVKNQSDKEFFSEWRQDLSVAEKGAQKSCGKKIRFEFDPVRFKGFLSTGQSPGTMCGDIAKALEYDLCTDDKLLSKVKAKLDKVKCYYTSASSDEIKMRFNKKELLVGFSEGSSELYEEALSWLQNNL